MADLVEARSIHIVGAGGAGMSGLAKLLAQAGHEVTGSDIKPARVLGTLRNLGVDTWVGHQPDRMAAVDLVVASSAVPATDPELEAARRVGVDVWERPQLLAAITRSMPALGVTGTHGKTTGSAMLVEALRSIGHDPSFMVGGELLGVGTNAHLGERGLFALETDEAFGTFLDLRLSGLVVTNIEADHLDHYGTVGALEEAFADVAGRVDGPVVVCLDDEGSRRLHGSTPGAVGYGVAADADWRIAEIEHRPGGIRFQLVHGGDAFRIDVARPGLHVARNAAGVLALLGEVGLDVAAASEALATFGGVHRRFEIRWSRDVMVVDDYAHHPTEVAATIEAAGLGHDGRIVAVFQPHRFTRTEEHATELGAVLGGADVVVVTDVYAAGEAPIPGVTGRVVADAVGEAAEVVYEPRRADVAQRVADLVDRGDLVLVMGAGDITLVADELPALVAARS